MALLGIVLAMGCGGRVESGPDGGTGGAGGASTGGAGGTTVGGTGGTITGGTGGTGGSGGTGGAPNLGACMQHWDCELAPSKCCACGALGLDQLTAINIARRAEHSRLVCGDVIPPCAPCAASIERYLVAQCQSGMCRGMDVRTDPTMLKCASDSDCTLRKGLGCCQCNSKGEWVAISRFGASILTSTICAPITPCDLCIPVPPVGLSAVCRNNTCQELRTP